MVVRRLLSNVKGAPGDKGDKGDKGLPGVNGVPTDDAVATNLRDVGAKTHAAAYITSARALGDVSLREWADASALANNENGNNTPLFTQAMTDLTAAFAASGQISNLLVPSGRWGFDSRLTPPMGAGGLRGYFGIKGEGIYRTTFVTAASNSWLGIDQQQVNDPDWAAEKMVFEQFTIDGTNQPTGSSYSSGLKGFILHNIRETIFNAVRVFNTHATGFGVDYSQADFFDCIAEYCGRGRKTHNPDPSTRFGSGSGFGIGFGQKAEELIRLIRVRSSYNGASGIFAEQLGQPEALFKAIGMMVSGAIVDHNAIGINDTGTRGSQYSNVFALDNEYAGVRVGISNASEQGGIDAQFSTLTTARNRFGVVLEGSAEGPLLFDGLESFNNTEDGVIWRDTAGGWPAPHVRFRAAHVHHNGGHGFNGATLNPIVGLDIDALVHDNGGDDFRFSGPLSRPRLRGKAFGSGGRPLSLLSRMETEAPDISLDIAGSRAGFLIEHAVADASKVNVYGLPTSVAMPLTRPVPDTTLTNWVGQSATVTYAASFTGLDGVNLGPHAAAEATGTSPRLVSTGIPVAENQVWTLQVDVLAPKGTSIQPAARFGTGGSAVWVPGPISRATGSVQHLHVTVRVPAGQTVMAVGALGSANASPDYVWGAGKVLRVTRANATRGGTLWPYIAGDQPNCVWDGTAGASSSTFTPPASVTVRGFSFNFATIADGALPSGVATTVSSGTVIPLAVAGGKLTYGSGGNAPRTTHTWDGDGANGTLRATVANVGEFWLSLLARATDAGNYIAVDFQRNTSTHTVRLSKRVAGTLTEVAYTPAVELKAGDVVDVVLSGTSVEVKVNGTSTLGGPQTITEHATVTRHGVLLSNSAVARTEALSRLSFTPV